VNRPEPVAIVPAGVLDHIRSPVWSPNDHMLDLRLPAPVRSVIGPPLGALGCTIADTTVPHPWSKVEHHLTVVDGVEPRLYLLALDPRVIDKPSQDNVDALARLPALIRGPATIRIFGHPAGPHLAIRRMTDSWRIDGLDVGYVIDRTLVDFTDTDGDADSIWALLDVEPSPAAGEAPTPVDTAGDRPHRRVFLSYSHRDDDIFQRLLVHLQGISLDSPEVDVWTDERVRAADQWLPQIERALREATCAILLLSADFLASEFVRTHELPQLLGAARERGLLVFWLKAEPVNVPASIAAYQALHVDPPLGTLRADQREQALAAAVREFVRRLDAPSG
jgi:hypothetical protein